MEEVNLHPTIRRIDSTSTNSAIGSDYEIESICGLGGSEPYVKFSIFISHLGMSRNQTRKEDLYLYSNRPPLLRFYNQVVKIRYLNVILMFSGQN